MLLRYRYNLSSEVNDTKINAQVQMLQPIKNRLDSYEAQISSLETQARLQLSDSTFSRQFESLIVELENDHKLTFPTNVI